MTHDVFWLKGEKGVPKRRNLVYTIRHQNMNMPTESERYLPTESEHAKLSPYRIRTRQKDTKETTNHCKILFTTKPSGQNVAPESQFLELLMLRL